MELNEEIYVNILPKKNIPISEFIGLTSELVTEDNIKAIRECVGELEKHIASSDYNLFLFTGKSGIISDKLMANLDKEKKIWLEYPVENRRYNDPRGINLMLDELGRKPNETKLLSLDDVMFSGNIKAKFTMIGLSRTNLSDYGFAAIMGPYRYHDDEELTYDEVISSIAESETDEDKLFFPAKRNKGAWQLLKRLERLSDYYETSEEVRFFVDNTLDKILNIDSE